MRVKARFGDTDSAEYDTEDDNALADDAQQISETSPLLKKAKETATARRSKSISHHDHNHATKPKAASSGHDHDDNLRGMFLHVLGDALGNVGVMASAIIIWKWDNPYRFYFDPAISLFITLIILKSAIPLVRDTAKPLLQATPEHVNVQDIREDIESLPGIVSCHHVHVWALTRSKLVATMDVQLDFDFEQAGEQGQRRWMELARAIKACLRGWQIYSSTVQPEWCINEQHGHGGEGKDDNGEGSSESSGSSSKVTVVPSDGGRGHAPCEHGECLLADDGGAGMQCCVPAAGSSGATTPSKKGKGSGGHDHGHDDEHGHGHGHSH
jgi:zinc transporter 1